ERRSGVRLLQDGRIPPATASASPAQHRGLPDDALHHRAARALTRRGDSGAPDQWARPDEPTSHGRVARIVISASASVPSASEEERKVTAKSIADSGVSSADRIVTALQRDVITGEIPIG